MSGKTGVEYLQRLKETGEKITSLTAYDASFARILDAAGVELVLVGDSLGMVLQGNDDTLGVSMRDMIYHSNMVSRACRRALVVVDMPYRSYDSVPQACDNARRLQAEGGAEVVKLEGGIEQAATVSALVKQGIPVCGHIGLLPQSIKKYGGYKVQGRGKAAAARIRTDALALQDAGACMLVMECIPARLAERISKDVTIPAIGIGAGAHCDGQVLVCYDLLGLSSRTPRMAKNFLEQGGDIPQAVRAYIRAVKTGAFPEICHTFE